MTGDSILRAANERVRAIVGVRDSNAPEPSDELALQVYASQAQVATGHVVGDHLIEVVHKGLTRLAQTRKFESAKDPVEALHDLRVASRRLRAFLDVFEPLLDPGIQRRANGPLRRITRTVRAARDWDVQLNLLQERHAQANTDIERITLEDLMSVAARHREREVARARRRLRKVDFDELNFAVCAALGMTVTRLPSIGSPTRQLIRELLRPFADADALTAPTHQGVEHAEALHELRIRLKKLRYAIELFEPALGSAFEELHAPVEYLQDLLGRHHDLIVATQVVEGRRRRLERDARCTLAQALGALGQQLVAEQHALVEQVRVRAFDAHSWCRALNSGLEPTPTIT